MFLTQHHACHFMHQTEHRLYRANILSQVYIKLILRKDTYFSKMHHVHNFRIIS